MPHPTPALQALSPKEQTFVRAYIETGDGKAAATAAGYSGQNPQYYIFGLPHVLAAVQSECQRLLVSDGVVSLQVIRHLRDKASSEKVRLEAAKLLAAMAGYSPVATRNDKQDKQLSDMTPGELRQHIEDNQKAIDTIEGELAARAKPVNAPDPAPLAPNALTFLD